MTEESSTPHHGRSTSALSASQSSAVVPRSDVVQRAKIRSLPVPFTGASSRAKNQQKSSRANLVKAALNAWRLNNCMRRALWSRADPTGIRFTWCGIITMIPYFTVLQFSARERQADPVWPTPETSGVRSKSAAAKENLQSTRQKAELSPGWSLLCIPGVVPRSFSPDLNRCTYLE